MLLVQRLEDLEKTGRVETIQTTALLRSTRILRRVLETWGDLLSLNFQWEIIRLTLVWKTRKGVSNNYKQKEWQILGPCLRMKKQWNMIAVLIGVLGTDPKGLKRELEELESGRIETIQLQHCSDWREYWRSEETCCHSGSNIKLFADVVARNNNNNEMYIVKRLVYQNMPLSRISC